MMVKNYRSNHVDTVHECDRQTDRITIAKTMQRIASHGKNAECVAVEPTPKTGQEPVEPT